MRIYVTRGGAKAVARALSQRGVRYRTGVVWNKNLVHVVLDEEAVVGRYPWGRRRNRLARPRSEWITIPTPPIVDAAVYELAHRLRRQRDVHTAAGRAIAMPRVLTGLVFCGRCGASCQLETSGKTVDGQRYRYCYYSCRAYCRTGKEACVGTRVATDVLDAAVLRHLADQACTHERVAALSRELDRRGLQRHDVAASWRALITADHDVGRAYAVHLIERIELHDDRAIITASTGARGPVENRSRALAITRAEEGSISA
jgi:hypothetical protein